MSLQSLAIIAALELFLFRLQQPIADTNIDIDAEPVKIPEFSDDSDSIFKGRYHRQVHSDGNFQSTAADDSGAELSGDLFNGSSSDTDDLVNKFLELDKDNGDCVHPDGCDGDGERKKSMRRRQRGLRGHEGDEGVATFDGFFNMVYGHVGDWILSNKQSATRSKDRKHHYLTELEQLLLSLQSKATNLSTQIKIYQRDATGLTTEYAELKIRLQAMEQQAQLGEAVSELLMQELQRLQIATGHITSYESQRASLLGIAAYTIHSIAVPINLAAFSVQPTNLSTPQSVHYSPLTSPSTAQSTVQPMHHSSLTSPSTVHCSPLTSPFNCAVQLIDLPVIPVRAMQRSALTSPATVHSSPLTFPSIARTISSRAASPAPWTIANAFSTSETISSRACSVATVAYFSVEPVQSSKSPDPSCAE
ncbi:Transcription factor RF2b like [Actinidia chinensis var. chinensis]|uniref:Transcription factor RF2b like n=1 Tax=Actinidia chinensis var. chinensis TaxID=1590841 RepID=A0A2R6PPN4_ACTCC|nr:Transcription factor RF2b like [Actinidia chinensis var. chinensis]